MPFPNEHACRIENPDNFDKTTFRRKTIASGLDLISGKKPGSDSMQKQTYRFDKNIWTEERARAFCQRQRGSFEAAKKASQ